MIYGDAKARQMARSILPSTRRKSARDNLRAIKQRNRSRTRLELRLLNEDYEPRDGVDLTYYPMGEIRYEVRERREADKIKHFMSWAVKVTEDIPEPDGRLAKMRTILPDGLIGEHALDHLRFMDEFDRRTRLYKAPTAEEIKACRTQRHERRIRLLQEIVKSGWGHKMLNRRISHTTTAWEIQKTTRVVTPEGITTLKNNCTTEFHGPTVARKLGGLGDVETFLADLYRAANTPVVKVEPYMDRTERTARYLYFNSLQVRHTFINEYVRTTRANPDYHPEWLKSVDAFIDAWETAKGDRHTLSQKYRDFLR